MVTVLTRINMQEAAVANARVDFQLSQSFDVLVLVKPQCNTDDYLSHLSGRLQWRSEFGRVERMNLVTNNHLRPTVVAPEQ